MDNKSAITYFEKATMLKPQTYTAFKNLGCSYLDTENYEKALDCFAKSVEIFPENPGAQYSLAEILDKHFKKYDKAIVHYEKAIEIFEREKDVIFDQRNSNAFRNLGNIYENIKRDKEKAQELYKLADKHKLSFYN